ncbi:MAG: hypothetical protein LBK56_13455 [Gracilibacteraceae bacterium]|nr:hypothetical protein [Gracilibacteraceae bacterium]
MEKIQTTIFSVSEAAAGGTATRNTRKFLFTDDVPGAILLLQKEPFTSGAVNLISQKGEVTRGLLFLFDANGTLKNGNK